MLDLAQQNGIEVSIVSYNGDLYDYDYAVQTLKKLDIYIIVLIALGNGDARELFETFEQYGMTEFPYFYIGLYDLLYFDDL